jgi:hypothetical protein
VLVLVLVLVLALVIALTAIVLPRPGRRCCRRLHRSWHQAASLLEGFG